MSASPLTVAALLCVLLFPAVHALWRLRLQPRLEGAEREFTTGDLTKMAITGCGAPQAFCLLFWPIWPELLTAVTDVPLLLLPTGFIALAVSIGAIFDWK